MVMKWVLWVWSTQRLLTLVFMISRHIISYDSSGHIDMPCDDVVTILEGILHFWYFFPFFWYYWLSPQNDNVRSAGKKFLVMFFYMKLYFLSLFIIRIKFANALQFCTHFILVFDICTLFLFSLNFNWTNYSFL